MQHNSSGIQQTFLAAAKTCLWCYNWTATLTPFVLVGVGSINNTFGIQGVQENTFFFKSITDANKLRRQVSECFERAALPNTSPEVMLHLTIYHQYMLDSPLIGARTTVQRQCMYNSACTTVQLSVHAQLCMNNSAAVSACTTVHEQQCNHPPVCACLTAYPLVCVQQFTISEALQS